MLPELLNKLDFIPEEMFLLGLFLTAGTILIVRDWRFLILALLGQYILAGLILSRLVRPDIAALKVMIGTFICPILFLSVRQVGSAARISLLPEPYQPPSHYRLVNWWRAVTTFVFSSFGGEHRHRGLVRTGFIFRLLAVLLMILAATMLSRAINPPTLSPSVTTAIVWLILAGLVMLILSEDPLKVGLGLFTVFTGFDIFYTPLEASLLLTGLWGSVNLLIVLAIGYLIVAKGVTTEEEA